MPESSRRRWITAMFTLACAGLLLFDLHHVLVNMKPFKLVDWPWAAISWGLMGLSVAATAVWFGRPRFREQWYLPLLGTLTSLAVSSVGFLISLLLWSTIKGPWTGDFGGAAMLSGYGAHLVFVLPLLVSSTGASMFVLWLASKASRSSQTAPSAGS